MISMSTWLGFVSLRPPCLVLATTHLWSGPDPTPKTVRLGIPKRYLAFSAQLKIASLVLVRVHPLNLYAISPKIQCPSDNPNQCQRGDKVAA